MAKLLIQKYRNALAFVLILVLYVGIAYLIFHVEKQQTLECVPKIEKVEVVKEKYIEVPIKSPTIQVLKPAVVNNIELPKETLDKTSKFVVAENEIPPDDDYTRKVTTTVDTDTGIFNTYVHNEELPWVAFNKRGRVSTELVVKNNVLTSQSEIVGEFMQIKQVHVGIVAGYETPVSDKHIVDSKYIGVGAWMNF